MLQTDDSYFRVHIASDSRLQITIGSVKSNNKVKVKSRARFDANAWEYWALSFQMDPDASHSDIRVMLGVQNASTTETDVDTDRLVIDKGGLFHLGLRWANYVRPKNPLIGFIYNFHIDHGYYELSELHYGNTGCDAACVDNVCTLVSTECLEQVEVYDCIVDEGSSDCWLCYDPMCMNCSDLGTDGCDMCHDFTSLTSGECTC